MAPTEFAQLEASVDREMLNLLQRLFELALQVARDDRAAVHGGSGEM